MRIIFLGPPGAGKGTQSKQLAKKINLAHISTGDLLRQNVADATALGAQAKEYMTKGALVPDSLVTEMLSKRLTQQDTKDGFILDGYPRTIAQAESLDKLLGRLNTPIDLVINLDTSDAVIIQRLSGRLVCKKCGFNFHITNMPPKKSMICDHCQGELYQRADDKEDTIRKRMVVYNQETAPLLDYYKKQEKLSRVLSDGDAAKVLDEIMRLVQHHDDTVKA